jgi:hypothetical protein
VEDHDADWACYNSELFRFFDLVYARGLCSGCALRSYVLNAVLTST